MNSVQREEIKKEIIRISENIHNNRPLSEEELAILFLAAFFDEETHEGD